MHEHSSSQVTLKNTLTSTLEQTSLGVKNATWNSDVVMHYESISWDTSLMEGSYVTIVAVSLIIWLPYGNIKSCIQVKMGTLIACFNKMTHY